jgi:parvulin-like peptidyl-prolyl isomerase
MRRLFQLGLVLLVFGVVSLKASEVLDRIAATVNNTAILQSDVDVALRCEALLEGRQLNTLTESDKAATLQRLIDQELLRQQMGESLSDPKPEEVAERLREVRRQTPGAETDTGWHNLVAEYGVAESELSERVQSQIQIARFLEQRLRPATRVDQASIQSYYDQEFLPQLKKAGGQTVPALRDVRPQIQEILLQRRMEKELTDWLRSLREQSRTVVS